MRTVLLLGLLLSGCNWPLIQPESDRVASEPPLGPILTSNTPKKVEPLYYPVPMPEFSYRDYSGVMIGNENLKGEYWVIGFVFTRCAGTCPRITLSMRELQKETGVQLVLLTVDPDYDTDEIRQYYAKANFGLKKGTETRWLFLTGEKKVVYPMIRDTFRLPVKELFGKDRIPGWEILHSNRIFLIDPEGYILGDFDGISPEDMVKLRRRIQKAEEKENAEEKDKTEKKE